MGYLMTESGMKVTVEEAGKQMLRVRVMMRSPLMIVRAVSLVDRSSAGKWCARPTARKEILLSGRRIRVRLGYSIVLQGILAMFVQTGYWHPA